MPVVRYLSIESTENGVTAVLKDCIIKAFHRSRITKFSEWLLGLNVDGANVNICIHKGIRVNIKKRNRLPGANTGFEFGRCKAVSRFRDTKLSELPNPRPHHGWWWSKSLVSRCFKMFHFRTYFAWRDLVFFKIQVNTYILELLNLGTEIMASNSALRCENLSGLPPVWLQLVDCINHQLELALKDLT